MKLILLVLNLLLLSCATTNKEAKAFKPKKVDDFYKTSVMLLAKDQTGGGSGVIYKSTTKKSLILTNKHVCKLLKNGGEAYTRDNEMYAVDSWAESKDHDLCLVTVLADLGVTLKVKKTAPEDRSKVIISGHPDLYPHIVTEGHLSDTMNINVQVDSRECTEVEKKQDPITCVFFGKPIMAQYEATLTSATISPGSSGSGVFDSKGELIGLAFASNSESLAYGLTVPWKYLNSFVNKEPLVWQTPQEGANLKKKGKRLKVSPLLHSNDKFYDLDTWKKLFKLLEDQKCPK
jgi:S1-C subfamily serine protease